MSEKAVDSPPASESAAPAPPAKGGKKLWVAIVAVIVVVALVLSGLWIAGIIGGKDKEFEATIDPSPIVTNAGKRTELTVSPTWGDDPIDEGTLTYRWTVTPSTLGAFNLVAQPTVTFTAGGVAGSGTVKCVVTWVVDAKTRTVEVTASVTVNPPVIDLVVVVPTQKTFIPTMSEAFFAYSYNSVGVQLNLSSSNITWTVAGLSGDKYDLNTTSGPTVKFDALAVDADGGWLNATATDAGVSVTGSAVIKILSELPPRSSTTTWYDLFAVPNEPFWDMRKNVSGLDEPLTSEYPYIYKWYGSVEGNTWLYSSMRMNFTGKNLYEVNMNGRPTVIPMLGNYRGGTADVRWYANYMKPSDYDRYPAFIESQDDGWIWILNGTVTLDEAAARTVLGIGADEFESGFSTWWSANKATFKSELTDWYNYEGKVRVDIYNAYEYPFTLMYLEVEAEKVGDKVVLTYDTASWGIDVLLAYQIWDAGVLETNWYMEDMYFNATITPEYMNLSLDAVAEYASYAYTTTLEGTPCWYWEPIMQDLVPASADHPRSNFTAYADKTYVMFSPGSPINGQIMPFDYTPISWNLSVNETLILEWPSGDQMFLVHGGTENWMGTNTTREYGEMEMRHSEPMDAPSGLDMPPGQFELNNVTRQVIFRGPFDMYTWSKEQTLNTNLANEWDRIGLLPYGIPTVEFAMVLKDLEPRFKILADFIDFEGNIQSTVDVNTATNITVEVWDQYGRRYADYMGNITFASNDSAAVLPANYEFTGVSSAVNFSVVFNTPGYRYLNVSEVGNASRSVNVTGIQVGPIATSLAFQEVPLSVMSSELVENLFSMRVTVLDQFGNAFPNYTGTVHFSSSDAGAGVVLPADFTFVLGDLGTRLFTDGFALVTEGITDVTVVDMSDPTLTGTVQILVKPMYDSTTDYKIYDMFEQPWGEWWPTRWDFYQTDIIVTSEPHMNTMMFFVAKDSAYQIIMYAPYRYSIDADYQITMSVDAPVFMPVYGPVVDGASAKVDIRFEYLDQAWWWNYWQPTWGTDSEWMGDEWLNRSGADGYDLGTVYSVTMNREAAEQWLDMPQAANVATWWAANGETYEDTWEGWIDDQGNNVFDIFCGYEWPYDINGGTFTTIEEELDGNVTLTIAHVALGYEILVTRWLVYTDISPLEPYMEDFTMTLDYSKYVVNLSMDAVCQYSLKAVKANLSATDDPAWVWEPAKIDYVTKIGHLSDYQPYRLLRYTSWNAGDNQLGLQVPYEQTPAWFNLTDEDTLVIQLPMGTVPGFRGVALSEADIDLAKGGDLSGVYAIMDNGTLDLGYTRTGPDETTDAELLPYWNAGTKTLTLVGPMDFDNFRHKSGTTTPAPILAGNVLYHGTPWVEFNVTGTKAAAALTPEVVGETVVGGGVASEMMSFAVVAAATMLAVTALGACARRRY